MFRKAQPQPATTDTQIDIDDLLMVITTTVPADGSPAYTQATEYSVRQMVTSDQAHPFDGVQANGDLASHEIYRFTLSTVAGRPTIHMIEHDNGLPTARESFDPDEFAEFRTAAGERQPTSRHAQPLVIIPAPATPSHIDPAVAETFAALTTC